MQAHPSKGLGVARNEVQFVELAALGTLSCATVQNVTNDPTAKAFLSYSHLDNDREGGRIVRLASLISNEFSLLTGESIEIFTDRVDILWGEDWRRKLDEALQETTFFIPILTPTYFSRPECRAEMTKFTTSARSLGVDEQLLSIRYIPVPDLREDSVDELKAKAAAMQFEPWHELRLASEDSPEHRQSINRLAARLVQLTERVERGARNESEVAGSGVLTAQHSAARGSRSERSVGGDENPPSAAASPHGPEVDRDHGDDDEDGPIDILADGESAMESWGETVAAFPVVTGEFSRKFRAATAEMSAANAEPNSFAKKVQIARKLAADVEPEVAQIESLSQQYSDRLTQVDGVVRALYQLAGIGSDADKEAQIANFGQQLQKLMTAAREAMQQVEVAANGARENAKLSKDLRPVLRRFETALRNMVDGSTVIESWRDLVNAHEE